MKSNNNKYGTLKKLVYTLYLANIVYSRKFQEWAVIFQIDIAT